MEARRAVALSRLGIEAAPFESSRRGVMPHRRSNSLSIGARSMPGGCDHLIFPFSGITIDLSAETLRRLTRSCGVYTILG
jgi:hypothetical protein